MIHAENEKLENEQSRMNNPHHPYPSPPPAPHHTVYVRLSGACHPPPPLSPLHQKLYDLIHFFMFQI